MPCRRSERSCRRIGGPSAAWRVVTHGRHGGSARPSTGDPGAPGSPARGSAARCATSCRRSAPASACCRRSSRGSSAAAADRAGASASHASSFRRTTMARSRSSRRTSAIGQAVAARQQMAQSVPRSVATCRRRRAVSSPASRMYSTLPSCSRRCSRSTSAASVASPTIDSSRSIPPSIRYTRFHRREGVADNGGNHRQPKGLLPPPGGIRFLDPCHYPIEVCACPNTHQPNGSPPPARDWMT